MLNSYNAKQWKWCTSVESKKRKLSHISIKSTSTESQTMESAFPTHANTSDLFRAHSLLDPALAVGDIDNIEFCSDAFFENGEM